LFPPFPAFVSLAILGPIDDVLPKLVARLLSFKMLVRSVAGIRFNDHVTEVGPIVFAHACKLRLEGMLGAGLWTLRFAMVHADQSLSRGM
jgi:hypothetical protein